MAMTLADGTIGETAGAVFDALEDFLRVDRPMRPSVQRRVDAANADAIRTLRRLVADDETMLAPANVRTICNAIARRHDVNPRYMLSMHELGEQLTLEFASAILPSATRARLIQGARLLDRDRTPAASERRRRASDRRPSPRVEWIAVGQAVVALACVLTAVLMTHGGEDFLGLAFAIVAVASLAFARAMLAISTDRRARVHLADGAVGPANRAFGLGGDEIDLRSER